MNKKPQMPTQKFKVRKKNYNTYLPINDCVKHENKNEIQIFLVFHSWSNIYVLVSEFRFIFLRVKKKNT